MKSITFSNSASPDRVSDVIPWRSMIAPGVMLQKLRHGLQRSYAVRGPDVMGESPEVQGALMLRANDVLKRLGGRWMLQSEAQRQRVPDLPAVTWPSPVLHLIDQERRTSLLEEPGSRETRYYMTLTWWPPTASTRRRPAPASLWGAARRRAAGRERGGRLDRGPARVPD
jgi:type IV secretory pathway VirB4 component